MKFWFFRVILFFFLVNTILAQNIKLTVNNCNIKSIVLYAVKGDNLTAIDTLNAITNGVYELQNKKQNYSGLYRIIFSSNNWLDFVIDNEDIELKSDLNNLLDSMKVIKSKCNSLFYEFIKRNKEYKYKSELLLFVLDKFPQDDEYYTITRKRLNKLQDEYLYFINSNVMENQEKFIAKYILSAQLPVVEFGTLKENQIEYLRKTALNNVDFSEESLINSDVFTNKAIEYLTYFRNPQLTKEELEKEFEKAVDSVLIRAKINNNVYHQLVEYFLKGFRDFGFDGIINYLIDNYVIKDNVCLDQKLETSLERRILQAKKFKVGEKVPNIKLRNLNNEFISLYEIDSEKLLIIFYSTKCPHCVEQLPLIYDFYKKYDKNKLQVVAVSMDTSQKDWENFINANNFDWFNVSDLNGWEGETVRDYLIYATPTLFLIDKDKKVISMPMDVEDINKYIK